MSAALSGVVRFRARTSSEGGALAARSWASTFPIRGAFIFGHMMICARTTRLGFFGSELVS